jgi:hypothetical protein
MYRKFQYTVQIIENYYTYDADEKATVNQH